MQRKMAVKKRISLIFIFAGIAFISAALLIEAMNYPWGSVFESVPDEASLPDPTPIVLKGEDVGSTLQEGNAQTESAFDREDGGMLPGSEEADAPASVYVQLGIIKIPKLNVSQYVLDGTQRQMRYGIGHVVGTAGIGEKGNCAIAGHRTTAFRYLDKLAAGDTVVFEVGENAYTYTVYDSFTVLPDEIWVLSDIEGEDYALTMITCTPYLVSSHRLIVMARLSDTNGIAPEGTNKESAPDSAAQ